jgi:hypothetical protein
LANSRRRLAAPLTANAAGHEIAATREAFIRKCVTPRLRFSFFGGCDARAIVRRDCLHVP